MSTTARIRITRLRGSNDLVISHCAVIIIYSAVAINIMFPVKHYILMNLYTLKFKFIRGA